MPRRATSGTQGLLKRHRGCSQPTDPADCACPWRGRHNGIERVLAEWTHEPIDPHSKTEAVKVLRRFASAIDEYTYDPAGERPAQQGAVQTLATFIEEWRSRYAEEYGLTANSLNDMLNVIAAGRLGGMKLQEIGGASEEIERWLNAAGKARKWKATTWNDYHNLLNRVLKQATVWKTNGKPRLAVNPMPSIQRRVKIEPEHFKQRHLEEDVEDRLFAACERLNRPQHRPTKTKITQQQADQIRTQLAAGERGIDVAARFKVSPATVSSIKHGDIWNPENLKVGTKGNEMHRRLIAAFDSGLRAGEMLLVQLHHVNWKPVKLDDETSAYVITLPPSISKGGKTTGKPEMVYAATSRFRQVLETRRFQLKSNPESRTFIFGTEDGRQVRGFRRMWRELFALAELRWGRDNGIVWHTTRHEFISRLAENTKDPVLTQEIARHKDLETTQGYFHARRDRQLAAAAGLDRRR